MAESGTIAPPVVAPGAVAPETVALFAEVPVVAGVVLPEGAAGVAADPDPAPEEDEDGAIPVRVPEPIAAALVDSPLAAAMEAIFEETGLVFELAGVDEVTPGLVAVLTNTPPAVTNSAGAPAPALLGAAAAGAPPAALAVVALAAVVDARVGTAAGAPVEPVLM